MDFEYCTDGSHPEPDVSSKHHFDLQESYELFSEKVNTAVPIKEHLPFKSKTNCFKSAVKTQQ